MSPLLCFVLTLAGTDRLPVAEITGLVVDVDLDPQPDAAVTAYHAIDHRPLAVATADETGRFALELYECPARVRVAVVTADGAVAVMENVGPLEAGPFATGTLIVHAPVALRGLVVRADGSAAAGASLIVRDPVVGKFAPVATTGDDGSFGPLPFPPLELEVVALHLRDGATDGVVRRAIDLRDPRSRDLTLHLADVQPIRGRVVDREGAPIAAATVEPLPEGDRSAWRPDPTSTDDDGRFVVRGNIYRDARARLRFTASGYAPTEVWLDDEEPVDVALAPSFRLRLDVSAGIGDDRLSYVVHRQVDGGWRQETGTASLQPDDGGVATVDLPRGAMASLSLTSPGRLPRRLEDLRMEGDAATISVTARQSRTGSIEGTVLGVTGQPVQGARVELGRARTPLHATRADDSGRFRFDDVDAGAWNVQAREAGLRGNANPVTVETDATATVDVEARSAPVLDGRVLVDGAPPTVPLRVDAFSLGRLRAGPRGVVERMATTMTDEEGRFAFKHLDYGSVVLVPADPPHPIHGAVVDVGGPRREAIEPRWAAHLSPGRGDASVEIEVSSSRPAWLLGTVTLNEAPLADASVRVWRGAEKWSATTTTDPEGRFRVVIDRSIGDDYQVDVRAGTLTTSGWVDTTAPVDLALYSVDITGTVRVASDVIDPQVRILLQQRRDPTDDDLSRWTTRSQHAIDADGSFRVEALAAGSFGASSLAWRIAVEDALHRVAFTASKPLSDTALIGDAVHVDVAAPLACGADLKLVVTGEERPPFATAHVTAAEGEPPLARPIKGWFVGDRCELRGLPPGRLVVRVEPHGPWVEPEPQIIEATAEKTQALTFDVRRADG